MIIWFNKNARAAGTKQNDVRISFVNKGKSVNISFTGDAALEFGLNGMIHIGRDDKVLNRLYFVKTSPNDPVNYGYCYKLSKYAGKTLRITISTPEFVSYVKSLLSDKKFVERDLRRCKEGVFVDL